ncbi:MAG: hypothetical protein HY828_16275 [Actinobacteria bacterium]|nr:hypothetical protein [Actinomycetota bacterium]
MRRFVVTAVAVGAAALVACSDGESSGATSSSTSVAASSTTAVVDDSVVTRYLAALDQGDLTAANALRCAEGRVPDGSLALFEAEVAAVKAAAGGRIEPQQVSIVEPITLGSLLGSRPDSQVAFSLATPDGPTSLLAVAVITQDGEPRLCGEMQEGSPGVQSAVSAATITPMAATIADLATALPAEIVTGAAQVDDAEVTDLSQVPGAIAGWTRAWSTADGGLRVTLFRTDSSDAAVRLGKQLLTGPGLDSAEHLADLSNGFQGVSAVSSPWTWAHPASIGSRVDTAVGVAGDVAVVVEVAGVRAGQGHDTITQAATNLSFS